MHSLWTATHAGIPQPSVMKIESTVNQSAVIVLDDTVSANEGYEYTLLVVNDNDTQEVSSQLQTVYIYEVPDFDVVYTARVTVTDQCSRTSVTAQNFKIAGKQTDSRNCYSHVCAKHVGVFERRHYL